MRSEYLFSGRSPMRHYYANCTVARDPSKFHHSVDTYLHSAPECQKGPVLSHRPRYGCSGLNYLIVAVSVFEIATMFAGKAAEPFSSATVGAHVSRT